jgi:hypothetical protein
MLLGRLAAASVGVMVATTQWNAVRVGGGLALEDVLMALAFALVVCDMVVNRRSVGFPPAIMTAALAFAIPGLVAALFPPAATLTSNPLVRQAAAIALIPIKSRENLGSLAKFEAAILVMPLMVGVVGTSRKRVLQIADMWALGAIVSAVIATTDMVGITHLSRQILGLPYNPTRQSGLTLEPNHLAVGALLVLPLVVMWLTRSRRWRLAGIIGLAVLLTGIYASRSRGAEVLAPCALAFSFAAVPQLRPWLAKVAPVVALLGIAVVVSSSGTLHRLLYDARLTSNAPGVVGSDSQRAQLRAYSLQAFEARPVTGVGYTVIDDAHDIYVQLLAAGGVIGLLAFVVLIMGALGAVRRLWRSPDHLYAAAMGAALAVWALAGVVENQLTDRYLYVPLAVLIALAKLQALRAVRSPEVLRGPGRGDGAEVTPRREVRAAGVSEVPALRT